MPPTQDSKLDQTQCLGSRQTDFREQSSDQQTASGTLCKRGVSVIEYHVGGSRRRGESLIVPFCTIVPGCDGIDGELIPESEVIGEYLDEQYPDKALLAASPPEHANVRVLSRIGDICLMHNVFLSLVQMMPDSRNQGVVYLLVGQVRRGIGALNKHLGDGAFEAGDTSTRADCSLVPALWMCSGSLPRLGAPNPLEGHDRVTAYWASIQ